MEADVIKEMFERSKKEYGMKYTNGGKNNKRVKKLTLALRSFITRSNRNKNRYLFSCRGCVITDVFYVITRIINGKRPFST
jgi:hypothetical protein